MRISTGLLLPVLVVSSLSSASFADRHHTIAHEILDLESAVVDVSGATVELLDALLDEAKALELSKTASTPAQAHDVLARIDELLTRHGFAIPASGNVELLRDALSPIQINKSAADRLTHPPNARRAEHILANKAAAFHFFGSDKGAFLYLAIAEVSGLPLR